MIKEIIEFFKKLFGKEEVSVNEVSYINDSDIVEEDNIIKTKILLNNNISGYDIKNLSIKANNSSIENIEIPDKESRVVVLSTNEQPQAFELICDVVATDNGEAFNQLKATCLATKAPFQTINITNVLVNLKKITFDASVIDEGSNTNNCIIGA